MELTIDTASADLASVALSAEGGLLAELTWRCFRNHSVELMPTIQRLLDQMRVEKNHIGALFVCTGPGSYAGLRVGMSVAKGLAYGLSKPLIGVGRLEADAYAHAAYPGSVCAVHRAGRDQFAWAVYRRINGDWREENAPRLSSLDEMLGGAPNDVLFCGEIGVDVRKRLGERRIAGGMASVRRAGFVAELGWQRLVAGAAGDVNSVRPIYLKEAAIGPTR
jgi:tRNA threonylcarbamoyladenosine biosynthesis protein TsaB